MLVEVCFVFLLHFHTITFIKIYDINSRDSVDERMKKRPDTRVTRSVEEVKSETLTVEFLICEALIRNKAV